MREIVFQVRPALEGQWMGHCLDPALQIWAPTLEELHHEAREALIERLGPSHVACRIRLRRPALLLTPWLRPGFRTAQA